MQFGFISLGENRYPGVNRSDREYYQEYLELAQFLDEMDYVSLWTGEHHFNHIATVSSPLTLLAGIAGRTKRIKLATGVNVLAFHNPIRLAEDYATLDQVSDGRAILGAGTGYALGEYKGFGMDINEARPRFREVLTIVEKALRTHRFGFEGDYYHIPDLPLVPIPVQERFEMCVAVLGSMSTIEWAAERGYNLVTSSQSQALIGANLPEAVQRYRSIGNAHGHKNLRLYVPFFMLCSEDEDEIAAEFGKMVGYWQHLSLSLDKGLPQDLQYWEKLKDSFAVLTVEQLHNRQTAFGRPEKLIDLFLQVAQAGVDEVIVEPFYGPQTFEGTARNLSLFREKVMPYVDDRFGGPKYEWNGEKTVLIQEAKNKK